MKDNHSLNDTCTFTEQLTAYLYDEISGAERNSFESHLKNCQTCTGELADFSMLRISVQEWRKTDFALLPTPIVNLPALRQTAIEKPSWFETIWATFSTSPARAAFATFLIFSIFAGLFWVASKSFRSEELADLSVADKTIVKEKSAPVGNETDLSPSPSPAKQNVSQIKTDETAAKSPADSQSAIGGKKDFSDKNRVVTEKTRAIPATQKSSPKPDLPKQNLNRKVKNPARNEVPAIDDEDEENESLRLTDLFDEIGMNKSDDREESK